MKKYNITKLLTAWFVVFIAAVMLIFTYDKDVLIPIKVVSVVFLLYSVGIIATILRTESSYLYINEEEKEKDEEKKRAEHMSDETHNC